MLLDIRIYVDILKIPSICGFEGLFFWNVTEIYYRYLGEVLFL